MSDTFDNKHKQLIEVLATVPVEDNSFLFTKVFTTVPVDDLCRTLSSTKIFSLRILSKKVKDAVDNVLIEYIRTHHEIKELHTHWNIKTFM